jgi:heme-degrading monooxygenase HmoA
MSRFAPRPEPPYYAVIFTSQRAQGDDGYSAMAQRMAELAAQQPGYLGIESTRDADGLGITVSYWKTLADVAAWRRQSEHAAARDQGRRRWYSHYELRVAKVERAYGWDRGQDSAADPGLD